MLQVSQSYSFPLPCSGTVDPGEALFLFKTRVVDLCADTRVALSAHTLVAQSAHTLVALSAQTLVALSVTALSRILPIPLPLYLPFPCSPVCACPCHPVRTRPSQRLASQPPPPEFTFAHRHHAPTRFPSPIPQEISLPASSDNKGRHRETHAEHELPLLPDASPVITVVRHACAAFATHISRATSLARSTKPRRPTADKNPTADGRQEPHREENKN